MLGLPWVCLGLLDLAWVCLGLLFLGHALHCLGLPGLPFARGLVGVCLSSFRVCLGLRRFVCDSLKGLRRFAGLRRVC